MADDIGEPESTDGHSVIDWARGKFQVLVVCTAGKDRSPAIARGIRDSVWPAAEVIPAGCSLNRTNHNDTIFVDKEMMLMADLILAVERTHYDRLVGAREIMRGIELDGNGPEIVLLGAGGAEWKARLPDTVMRAVRIVRRRLDARKK